MFEAQQAGVQRVARHHREAVFDELPVFGEGRALEDAVAAVAFVVEQRVPDPRHVDADLVGAPRFETALHEGYVTIAFQHLPVRHGVLAVGPVGEDEHLLPILGTAADVARDGPLVLVEIAPHQSHVAALDRVVEELFGQPRVGLLVLGDHQQPRGVLVDAVHQSRAVLFFGRDSLLVEVVHQRIDQRAAVIAHPRVHDQSGRFVHEQQPLVLVGDVERNVLGDELHLAPRVGHHDLDAVERLDLVARLGRLAVDEDVPAVGRRLNAVARAVLHPNGQELVQPHGGLALVGRHRKVFVEARFFFVLRICRNGVQLRVVDGVSVGHQSKNPSLLFAGRSSAGSAEASSRTVRASESARCCSSARRSSAATAACFSASAR